MTEPTERTAPAVADPAPGARPPILLLPPDQSSRLGRIGLAAVVLVVAGILWVTFGLLFIPRRDPMPVAPPRIVIALGAGVRDDSALSRASAVRLERAIDYAREHNASIVTTRTLAAADAGGADVVQRLISAAGLAGRWISLPQHISNTRDEALAMHMVIADTQPIAVVTSPLHTRRACVSFEHVGYRVTCIASAQDEWWRLPYLVAYETAAYVRYKQRGWW